MAKEIEIEYISKADLISVIVGEFVLWMESDDYLEHLGECTLNGIYNDARVFFNAISNDLSIIDIKESSIDIYIKSFLMQYFNDFSFINSMYNQIINKINLIEI